MTLMERALAIREAALGPVHPDVALVLNNLASLGFSHRRFPQATSLFVRALTYEEQHLRTQTIVLSEERLASFLRLHRTKEELVYSLVHARLDDSRTRHLALATALLRKGRSAEELASISRTIYRSLGAEDRDTFEQLRALRTQLATLSLAGPGRRAPADHARLLEELTERGDALETSLARRSALLRDLKNLPYPEQIVERVAARLPKDGALVEFIVYRDRPPGTSSTRETGEPRYLALLLFPDGRTGAVDLGSAAPMDRAIQRLREAFAKEAVAWQPAAEEVYRLAFLPLRPVLGKTRRLFLAPDGRLSLVPFDALHDGRRSLIDRFDFTYLQSGRELLPRPEGGTPSDAVVILADPDLSAPSVPPPSKDASTERSPTSARLFATQCKDSVARGWAALPSTRQEAEALQHLLPQARLLLGVDATKEALLQVKAPGILHVATHGFFLEDIPQDADVPGGARGLGETSGNKGPTQCPANPMLRSGLVLAGVQAPVEEGVPPRHENSLATSLELLGMDLWGTQLVVLSACDTGRGDVKPGQGVYGLRRALRVAGAETVVMSLWKVNDETTRHFMEAYYRRLLAGQGRTEALHEAMKAIREAQPHPYSWASFIAVGQRGPLRGLTPPGAQP